MLSPTNISFKKLGSYQQAAHLINTFSQRHVVTGIEQDLGGRDGAADGREDHVVEIAVQLLRAAIRVFEGGKREERGSDRVARVLVGAGAGRLVAVDV